MVVAVSGLIDCENEITSDVYPGLSYASMVESTAWNRGIILQRI